uniref:Uncharacterized protein n=1 Tax=Amphiprion percula TaxID=161767 RepID=A0A3P8RQ78_AMPPE
MLSFPTHTKIQYKEDLGGGTALPETPEMERAKRNQRNISTIQYKEDLGGGTALPETPEMERAKRNQRNISTIQYKDSVGQGTAIPDLPEVKRVRETQKNISLVEEQHCSDPYNHSPNCLLPSFPTYLENLPVFCAGFPSSILITLHKSFLSFFYHPWFTTCFLNSFSANTKSPRLLFPLVSLHLPEFFFLFGISFPPKLKNV